MEPKFFALTDLLRMGRSLGFGAVIGACLGQLGKHFFPRIPLTDSQTMYSGMALGALAGRLLDWLLITLLMPATHFVGFYFKVIQLRLLKGLLAPKQREAILKKLAERHFLGK